MVCHNFKCVSQVYPPLNPCGALMSNAYFRAANLFCQHKYLTDNQSGEKWICNCGCKSLDYKAPMCCVPPRVKCK